MKSITCLISSRCGISLIYVILAYISSAFSSPPCGLYGAPPCQFLPAPPGQTPSCARPGKTYCEHIDNYPTYLIKHLVHKWGYEAKNLLVDETWDDFAAVAWQDTPVFYDPAFIFPQRHFNGNSDFDGYKYETPPVGEVGNIANYRNADTYLITKQQATTEAPTFVVYSSSGQRGSVNKNQIGPYNGSLKVSPNNPTLWLKRIVRDLAHKVTERSPADFFTTPKEANVTTVVAKISNLSGSVSVNTDLYDIFGVKKEEHMQGKEVKQVDETSYVNMKIRPKRQSPGRNTFCQTTSQFITPQAALNSKGNWMFVVNEANTARQMVKTELCGSNTCSNLCQLPNGYNSRCEQKFVQKRLIALQANGQNLYTDTFWFPSCCVCTISPN